LEDIRVAALVETNYGKVQGIEDNGVRVFKGIPFAQPPVGRLRFRAPQAPRPWAGVRDAREYGPAAVQNQSLLGPALGFDIGPSNEDCLYLNVWTPGLEGRRPVLVWIHGGAFVMGAGSQALYDGTTLSSRGDVVVVTINYRLGCLGFLRLPGGNGDGMGSGNEGLLDQIAALEWVRDNIAGFGGDPRNVTIFGESAGSISVATLLGTPRAQGLFQRAILQSGSANLVSSRDHAERVAAAMLQEIGADGARGLQGVATAGLLELQQRLYFTLQPRVRGLVFAPAPLRSN
jgi:para-nitrobenzyl esterase